MSEQDSTVKATQSAIHIIEALEKDYLATEESRKNIEEQYRSEKKKLFNYIGEVEKEIREIKSEGQRIIHLMRRKISKIHRDYRKELRFLRGDNTKPEIQAD